MSAQGDPDVLVVAQDTRIAPRVRDLLREVDESLRVQRVDNDLMALGHLATFGPPALVLVRLDDLAESPEHVAEALRRLAPRTRLVLVASPEREPDAIDASEGAFDDYLLEPLNAAALARLIDRAEVEPAPTDDPELDVVVSRHLRMSTDPAAEGGQDHAPSADDEDRRPELFDLDLLPETSAALSALAALTCGESRVAPPEAESVGEAALGDIDLVDALLAGSPDFVELAVQLIRQHSGLGGLGVAASGDLVPEAAARVELKYDRMDLGLLHADPPATDESLAVWATWLSRWMALHRRLTRFREMALRDELTGLWNRRYFYHFLQSTLNRAAKDRFQVTVLVFDIDNFKIFNDEFGHASGDEILREAARMMQSAVRKHDVVARIGGDEFAVIFWDAEGPRRPNSEHPHEVNRAAERFREAVATHGFPKLTNELPATLTISGGLASFPWDGRNAKQLVQIADEMALRSKHEGKNAITLGPGAMRAYEAMNENGG